MSEIERWAPPAATSWSQRREMARIDEAYDRQAIVDRYADEREIGRLSHQAQMAQLKLGIIYRLGDYSLDRLEDLDAHRRAMAGLDPEINMLAMQIEMGAVAAANGVIRRAGW